MSIAGDTIQLAMLSAAEGEKTPMKKGYKGRVKTKRAPKV